MPSDWDKNFCGCFNDCSTCKSHKSKGKQINVCVSDACSHHDNLALYYIGIVTYVFPCYMFGMAAKSVDENCWVCACAYCIPLVNLCARVYIREKIRSNASENVSDQIL